MSPRKQVGATTKLEWYYQNGNDRLQHYQNGPKVYIKAIPWHLDQECLVKFSPE